MITTTNLGLKIPEVADWMVNPATPGVDDTVAWLNFDFTALDDVVLKDGTVPLSADWDIGTGRAILADQIVARDVDGLILYDDGGSNGIFIKDGCGVGIGLNMATISAVLHLKAGTTVAKTAPLKFTSGNLLTSPEIGAVEFLADKFYGTITTATTRKTFAFLESPTLVTPILGQATATSIAIGVNTLDTTEWAVLDGVTANKVIDHTTVSIINGNGITGGGDLTASRTLALTELADVWDAGSVGAINVDIIISHVANNLQLLDSNSGGISIGSPIVITPYPVFPATIGELDLVANVDISGNLTMANTKHIVTDTVIALDSGGLELFEDGGVGIFVKDGGNVGIGTTNPTYALHITSAFPILIIDRASGTYSPAISYQIGGSEKSVQGIAGGTGSLIAGSVSGDLCFRGNTQKILFSGDSGTTAHMTIGATGNIGIGTAVPTSKLQVVGLPAYANNAGAVAGGLTAGAFYRTNGDPDLVCVVH